MTSKAAASQELERSLTRRARALRTLHGESASTVLSRVVELVRDAGEGDLGAFMWLAGDATQPASGPAVVADDPGHRVTRAFMSRLQGDEHRQVVDFARLPKHAYRKFESLKDELRRRLEVTDYYQQTFVALRWLDNLRLIVEDDGQVLAWVGAVRTAGSAAFSRQDVRRMAPITASVVDAVVVLSRTLRAEHPDLPGDLICDAQGRVIAASAAGRRWLDETAVARHLRARVRQLDRGRSPPPAPPFVDAKVTRLDAGKGAPVSYLVHLSRRTLRTRARDAELSAAERRVAERAAGGATINAIAHALERSPETVRHQLKAAYKKLDVTSRVELARALDLRDPRSAPEGAE